MSIPALNWAFEQPVSPASSKFVLVALANFANEAGEAYPCIQTICNLTSLDRKTVLLCIERLIALGMISDTGKRKGFTSSVKVYLLSSPKNGATPKTEASSPNFSTKQSRFSVKQSQKRDTEPSGTIKEPSKNQERVSMSYVPTPESTARFERLRVALHEAMRRKPKQHWDYAEMSLLCEVNKREGVEEELTELLAFQKRAGRYFPHSLYALLSRWSETLDQSRQPTETNGAYRNNSQQVNGNTGTLNKPSAEKAARYAAIARRGLDKPVPDTGRP